MCERRAEWPQNTKREDARRYGFKSQLSRHQKMILFWNQCREVIDNRDCEPQRPGRNSAHDYPGRNILEIKEKLTAACGGSYDVSNNFGAETEDDQPEQN